MIIKRKMSAISLESAIRTCKVDTGYANKVESQRILDRNTMVCPVWNGVDTAGRTVSRDSFVTKTAGCNSAEDRVVVENSQRPQYMEYINLSANGIDGSIYGDKGGSAEMYGDTMPWNLVGDNNNNFNYPLNKQACLNKWSPECANNVNNVTGQFGNQLSSSVYPACGYYPYQQAMNQVGNTNEGFTYQQATAQNEQNKNVGRLGILRCSNNLKDNQTTVNVVAEIMKDPRANADTRIEARYNRAKAFLAMNDTLKAQADLDTLATDTRTVNGAEAKYLKAKLLYDLKKNTEAEKEVLEFAQTNTPHPFWLAKSFVLLADIYIRLENDFQAKQYLLSLQRNYTETHKIQTLITERLNAIAEREKQTIIQ